MSFSHLLTVSLNAVFYVWLRLLSWFVSGDTSPAVESNVYPSDDTSTAPRSPPEFSRPHGSYQDLRALISEAIEGSFLRTPESDASTVPSISFSPDLSSPLSSAPTTPDIDNEPLITVHESCIDNTTSESHSWNHALDIEQGLDVDLTERRDAGLSLLGSSTSLFSKLGAALLVPSQSHSPSKYLQPSTPYRSRSNSLLPQFTQDITSAHLKSDTSWYGDNLSIVATPGGTPPQSPGCYTSIFDFSMYDNDRRFGRIMDSASNDVTSSPTRSSGSTLPLPITPSRYLGTLPAICTPSNSPEEGRRVATTLDTRTLARLLEDPTKMHRPANTGLRPLILPRQAAKRHSLDISTLPASQQSGPRPLMLPQQLAKRPPAPTRSTTLGVGLIHGRQSSFMRKSISDQDCRLDSPRVRNVTPPPRQSRLFSDIMTLLNDDGELYDEPLVDVSTTISTVDSQQSVPGSSVYMPSESSMIMESIDQEERLLTLIGMLGEARSREQMIR